MLCAQCLRRLDTGAQRCPACGRDPLLAGRYRLDRALAEAPGENSFRATRVEDGLLVRVRGLDVADAGVSSTTLRESAARITKLEHRSLPRALEYCEIEGRMWLVHEFVRGRTLAEFAVDEPERAREPAWILDLLADLAGSLAYLHQQSPPLAHGQISVDTIYIADGQRACLLDPQLASTSSPAADVRTLAVVLTSLLAGETSESKEPPARWREHVDSKTAGVLERMLAHNVEHQISSSSLRDAVSALRVRTVDERRRPPTVARPHRPTPQFMMLEPVPNADGSVSQAGRPVRRVGEDNIPLLRPDELSRELSQAYRASAAFEEQQRKHLTLLRVMVVLLVATITALTTYLVVMHR